MVRLTLRASFQVRFAEVLELLKLVATRIANVVVGWHRHKSPAKSSPPLILANRAGGEQSQMRGLGANPAQWRAHRLSR